MQIQLKQAEIVIALKQYITAQGINLVGKDVSISFTAGRKEAGIVADLVIEDGEIPGYSDADVAEAPAAPVLSVVPTPPVTKAAEEETAASAPVVNAPVADEPPFDVTDAPAETPKTTSLFN